MNGIYVSIYNAIVCFIGNTKKIRRGTKTNANYGEEKLSVTKKCFLPIFI